MQQLEDALQQDVEKLLQLKEALFEAQRHIISGAHESKMENLEEVLLSKFEKTGLLDNVITLSKEPSPSPQKEVLSRKNLGDGHQSTDRRSSDHSRRASGSRLNVDESVPGHHGRDNLSYSGQESLGSQSKEGSRVLKPDSFKFQRREITVSKHSDASEAECRETSRSQDQESSGLQTIDSFSFRELNRSLVQQGRTPRLKRWESEFLIHSSSSRQSGDTSVHRDRERSRQQDPRGFKSRDSF